nr:hypothetical protein Iba_chr13cCG15650 [Ipomoea batatas]GMD82272.1 hypothetical protein Iba_chr13fCG6460 [Ipomoea batatas]
MLGPPCGSEHSQPPSHPAGYQYDQISCSWPPAGPVPATENHLRCERLHTRSPGLSQYNLLCSPEDPSEIRPRYKATPRRRATMGALELCGVICEFFPELLNIGYIGNLVKLFLLRELLNRAKTHKITQPIRAKPEHRMANVKLDTHTTSEAIKFRKLHCGHDLN